MHLFISYAKKDTRALAVTLAEELSKFDGITVWVDRDLKAGENWETEIQKHIDACDKMIVLISPDLNRHKQGKTQSYVLKEISYAINIAKKPIVPVMAQLTDLPLALVDLHYMNFTDQGKTLNDHLEELCDQLGIGITRPTVQYSTPVSYDEDDRRVLLYFVLDLSEEMCEGPLLAVQEGLEYFNKIVREMPDAVEMVHICVIGCTDTFDIVTPLVPISEFVVPVLQCGGSNDIARAYRKLHNFLHNDFRPRKNVFDGFDYRPLVFVLTGSNPANFEAATREAQLLLNRPNGYELGPFVALLVGDSVDVEQWKRLAQYVVPPSSMTAENISQYFSWVEPDLLIDPPKSDDFGADDETPI